MAKEISLKISFLQAPGTKNSEVAELHRAIKEGGYDFFRKNPELAPALVLFASGVKASKFDEEIKKGPEKGLYAESASALGGLTLRLRTLEEENETLSQGLSATYPEASYQIELTDFKEEPGYIALRPSADSSNYELSSGSSFGGLSVDISPAKEVASFALNKITEKVVSKVATKVAEGVVTKGAETAVVVGAEAVGAATTGPLAPVTFLLIEGGKIVLGWIKNAISAVGRWFKSEDNKELRWITSLGALFGGFFLLNSGNLVFGLPLAMAGGLSTLGMLSAAGAGVQIAGFGQTVVAGLTSVVLPSLVVPLVVSFLSIPLLVALILFIINSGAYVVPPSSFSVLGENPYIGVVKEVSPPGPFNNSDIPVTVTYTITVTARRGALTNIVFSHDCEVIRQGSTSPCPAPLPGSTPAIISPTDPYIFTYAQTYNGSFYRDSLVINTFSVTADTPDTQGTTASGATSIIIGNPPTACYNVAGSWPDQERVMILSAISNLVGTHPRYIQRLCAAQSQVNLYYDPSRVCGIWGCAPIGGNTIYFNSGGLGNLRNATYILAHESGHILAYGAPQLYAAYRAFPGTLAELPVCTYGGGDPNEGFAEAIAKYAISDSCMSNEPNNYLFVDTQIFR